MAGGGGNNMLDMGLMIAAGIAAPELAPVLMEGGAFGAGLGATAATGITGAALSGLAGAATGQDPAKAALMGGLGGAAAGYFGGVNPAEQGSMLAAGPNIPPAGVQEAIQTGAQNVGTEAARNSIINNPAYYDSVSPLGQLPSTGSISPTQLGTMNLGADANTAYGQAYGDVYKNVLANSAPATATNAANMFDKANMIGGGVAGINALLSAPPNGAYVPPGSKYTGGNLSKFKYDPNTYQPDVVTPPNPIYHARYAEGGIASLPTGGTVEQMSRENAMGGNTMFPQSGIGGLTGANTYQNATNTPMGSNVIEPTDAITDPYTGQMKFAAGGPTPTAQNMLNTISQSTANAMQNGRSGGFDPIGSASNLVSGNTSGSGSQGIDLANDPNYVFDPYKGQYVRRMAKGGVTANSFSDLMNSRNSMDKYMSDYASDPSSVYQKAKDGDYNAMLVLNRINQTPNQNHASGGIAQLAVGGKLLRGDGDGMSDGIRANIDGRQEARLADGEFVVPADVVSHLGNGSTDAGAKQLYSMMDRVRQARVGNKKQGKQINPAKYMMA